jgi:hypothetical protein
MRPNVVTRNANHHMVIDDGFVSSHQGVSLSFERNVALEIPRILAACD